MKKISIPQKPRYSEIAPDSGRFEIQGCYPGYGATIGNALRRVLLSSLGGSAITTVKIKGVSHEFSTIPGVKEDIIQVILNLKKIRFKMHSEEPVRVSLVFKGEGEITAKDIKCPSSIEVVSSDQIIATVTDKKAEIEMEMEVSQGLGYVPVEQQIREGKEIGVIAIDAIYSPVRRVNYTVENMRVGKRTDYDKVTLEINTDGSISPQDAFMQACQILVEQFSSVAEIFSGAEDVPEEIGGGAALLEEKEEKKEQVDATEIKITDLKNLSTRTLNVLQESKISKIKDIVKLTEEELKNLEGMGSKGIKEIKKSIGDFGLTLK